MPQLQPRQLVRLVVVLGIALVVGNLVGRRIPAQKAAFVRKPLRELQKLEPEIVFIGNSMLQTRIDAEYLSKKIGRPVYVLRYGGSGSAMWYLQFKNYVVASDTNPRRVVFFFRDRFLTDPFQRVTGQYKTFLQKASTDYEPVFERVLHDTDLSWRDWMYAKVQTLVPLHRARPKVDDAFDALGVALAKAAFMSGSQDAISATVNSVFALDNMRPIEQDDLAGTTRPARDFQYGKFEDIYPHSFLPEILALAQEHGIEVAFVRVQRRPPRPQEPYIEDYIDDLAKFFEARGLTFVDMTKVGDVPLDWYGKGDHIAKQYQRTYTDRFVERAPEIFAQ